MFNISHKILLSNKKIKSTLTLYLLSNIIILLSRYFRKGGIEMNNIQENIKLEIVLRTEDEKEIKEISKIITGVPEEKLKEAKKFMEGIMFLECIRN